MKKLGVYLLLLCCAPLFAAKAQSNGNQRPSFLRRACQQLHQVWAEGKDDLYLSGYAWHNRYTYRPEKIKSYNEEAWGGGLGKALFDEKGDWHSLYAIAFLDSHRHIQPIVGYAFLKMATLNQDVKAGIGYSAFMTSRVDIYNNIPFPGILPWAGVFYKRVSLNATYIPGSAGAGNVLFIIGRYRL